MASDVIKTRKGILFVTVRHEKLCKNRLYIPSVFSVKPELGSVTHFVHSLQVFK
jgi:hypothetical protein